MGRMWAVVACVGLLVAGACGRSGGAKTTDPTLPKGSSTTTSTTISYAVPATIDLAYVNKVMKALDHVYGDAIRHLAQTKSTDAYFVSHLDAIYVPSESGFQQQIWSREQQSTSFSRFRPVPDDPTTKAVRIVATTETCIFAAVDRDFAPVFKDPGPKLSNRYVGLVKSTGSPLNPTPWSLKLDGFNKDGSQPQDPCA